MSVQALLLQHGGIEERICFAAVDALPLEEFLSECEKEQLAAYTFPAKKRDFLLGRLAAKSAIGTWIPEQDLRRIEIRSGERGQPLIQHPQASHVEVTISHSHGRAVALAYAATFAMGIDLETVSAVSAGTVMGELEMSGPEQAWLATAGVDDATACCLLWTAREALGKSLKTGVDRSLGALALKEIRAVGDGDWVGRYLNYPQSQCLLQAREGSVLSLAMPGDAKLNVWPRLKS